MDSKSSISDLDEKSQKLKLALEHLTVCYQCRCSTTKNLRVMQCQIKEIWNLLHNCHNMASEILRHDETPPQETSHIFIKWR